VWGKSKACRVCEFSNLDPGSYAILRPPLKKPRGVRGLCRRFTHRRRRVTRRILQYEKRKMLYYCWAATKAQRKGRWLCTQPDCRVRWPGERAPLPTDTDLPTILAIDHDNAPPHVLATAEGCQHYWCRERSRRLAGVQVGRVQRPGSDLFESVGVGDFRRPRSFVCVSRSIPRSFEGVRSEAWPPGRRPECSHATKHAQQPRFRYRESRWAVRTRTQAAAVAVSKGSGPPISGAADDRQRTRMSYQTVVPLILEPAPF